MRLDLFKQNHPQIDPTHAMDETERPDGLLPLDCLSFSDVTAYTQAVSLLHRPSAYTRLWCGHLVLLGSTRFAEQEQSS